MEQYWTNFYLWLITPGSPRTNTLGLPEMILGPMLAHLLELGMLFFIVGYQFFTAYRKFQDSRKKRNTES